MGSVSPADRPDRNPQVEVNEIGDTYFETLGIPVLEGRGFQEREDAPVALVNAALAELLWPGGSAVGRRLAGDPGWEVVGVVGDVQMRSLRARANPAVYFPLAPDTPGRLAFAVSALQGVQGDRILEETLSRVAPSLQPVTVDVRAAVLATVEDVRVMGVFASGVAALALLLAAVGLYGTAARGVAERIRELGIRTALGASTGSLARLVMARWLLVSLGGVVLGVAIAGVLTRAVEGLLFGVGPRDPLALVASAGILMAAALVASWVPARRAARTDPLVTLRN